MSRSNMFVNIENEVKKINKKDLIQFALDSFREYGPALQSNNKLLGTSIFLGIRLGVMADGIINNEEKEFLTEYFENILKIPFNDTTYHDVSLHLEENDYQVLEKMLKAMSQIDLEWGVKYLKFILAFAYCDGKFEDDVAEKLDKIFGMSLLTNFIASGKEEVPKPSNEVAVSELEKVAPKNNTKSDSLQKNNKIYKKLISIENDMKSWYDEFESNKEKYLKEKEKIDKEYSELKSKYESKLQDLNNEQLKKGNNSDDYKKECDYWRNLVDKKTIEIDSCTGLFQGGKRKNLKAEREELRSKLHTVFDKYNQIEENFEIEKKKIKDKIYSLSSIDYSSLDKYLMVDSPLSKLDIEEIETGSEQENEMIKELIMESLYSFDRAISSSELKSSDYQLENLSYKKFNHVLNKMISSNLVRKIIVDHKTYYAIADSPSDNIVEQKKIGFDNLHYNDDVMDKYNELLSKYGK